MFLCVEKDLFPFRFYCLQHFQRRVYFLEIVFEVEFSLNILQFLIFSENFCWLWLHFMAKFLWIFLFIVISLDLRISCWRLFSFCFSLRLKISTFLNNFDCKFKIKKYWNLVKKIIFWAYNVFIEDFRIVLVLFSFLALDGMLK